MRFLLMCLIASVLLLAPATDAAASATNFGMASEFGRGLGAGVELGDENALVLGAGVGITAGVSSVSGFVGSQLYSFVFFNAPF